MRLHDVDILTSPDFASSVQGHREALRTFLKNEVLKQAGHLGLILDPKAVERLSDLSEPPRLKGWGLSLSHCPAIGGMAIRAPQKSRSSTEVDVAEASALGFDLEVGSRISDAAADRVANLPTEKSLLKSLDRRVGDVLRQHPTPNRHARFWCAKEASIKLFGNLGRKNPVYSDIEILEMHWQENDGGRGEFAARTVDSALLIAGDFFDIEVQPSTNEILRVTAALAYEGRLKTRR